MIKGSTVCIDVCKRQPMVSPDKLYEKLIERITKAQPKGNIAEVRHAYEFALKWHQDVYKRQEHSVLINLSIS